MPGRAVYDLARYHDRMSAIRTLLGNQCAQCEAVNDLHVDHIDPDEKNFTISNNWGLPWAVVLAELELCQLLCAACHREKSRSDGSFNKNKARGERVHQARLTEDDVLEIRRQYATGIKQGQIAISFGVSRGNIGQIVRGETWKHLL